MFERYSAIQPTEIDRYKEIVDSVKARGTATGLSASARTKLLVGRPRLYRAASSPRPRRRPLQGTRPAGARELPALPAAAICGRCRVLRSRSLHEGRADPRQHPVRPHRLRHRQRAAEGLRDRPRRARRARSRALTSIGLGLDFEVGKAGKYLQRPPARAHRAGARPRRDGRASSSSRMPLGSLPEEEGDAVLRRLREAMADSTLIATLGQDADADGFDRVIRFDGPRSRGAQCCRTGAFGLNKERALGAQEV